MTWITKTRLKYALAGAGAVYILLFVGYLVYAGTRSAAPQGPSELEAHPERQAEIVAQRRAEELRDQLQLSEEQTRQIAAIFLKYETQPPQDGDRRDRWRAQQEEINGVLTAEQRLKLQETRGQFGGPGGPGVAGGPGGPGGPQRPGGPPAAGGPQGQLTPERIESLKQSMTPEQRERFDKATQRMQKMRGQRGGGRGQNQDRQQ